MRTAFATAQVNDPGGAQLAVYLRGRPVVDLWSAGDGRTERPYDADSTQVLMSISKSLTATCAHLLQQRGLLDIDAPVARYWPEFAVNGKSAVTVRHLLSHEAGLFAFPPDAGIGLQDLFDWERCTSTLAGMAPLWEPGTAFAYHGRTFGYLVGEVVRRVDGRSVGRFFADEIARPLGLDLWIGLPEEEEYRVAPVFSTVPDRPLDDILDELRAVAQRLGINASLPIVQAYLGFIHGLDDVVPMLNSRAGHAAEMPAVNAIGNARSLARLYAALLGKVDGIRLLDEATVARARAPQTDQLSPPEPLMDLKWPPGLRYGLGYELGGPVVAMLGPQCFGHAGAGGRLSFADPATRAAIAYTCTSLGDGSAPDPRWGPWTAALTDALAAAARVAASFPEQEDSP